VSLAATRLSTHPQGVLINKPIHWALAALALAVGTFASFGSALAVPIDRSAISPELSGGDENSQSIDPGGSEVRPLSADSSGATKQ
jgi:hypothetical protein